MELNKQLIVSLVRELLEESNTAKAEGLIEAMSQKTDVIAYLQDNPDASNQEVADALGIRKNNVAGLRSRLRKEGLLPTKGETPAKKEGTPKTPKTTKKTKPTPKSKKNSDVKKKSKESTIDINQKHKDIINRYIEGWEQNPKFDINDFRVDSIPVDGINMHLINWDASALTLSPLEPIEDFESIGIVVFDNGRNGYIVEHDAYAGDYETPLELIDYYTSFNKGQWEINTLKKNAAKQIAFDYGRRTSKRLLKDI